MKKHLLTCLALTMIGTAGAQTTHFSIHGPGDATGSLYYSNIGAVQRSDGSFVAVERSASNGFYIRNFSASGTLQSTTKIASSACSIYTVTGVTAMGSNSLLVTGMGNGGGCYYVAKIDLVTHMVTVTTKNVTAFAYTAGPKVSTNGSSVYALYPSYDQYDINKYDSNLGPLWSKTCEVDSTTGKNPGMDCEMTDSTIVVIGKCDSYLGMGTFDNNTGALNAFKLYNAGYNRMYGMTKTADGHFLVAGMHSDTYAGIGSPLVAKIAGNGNVAWVKILDMSAPGVNFGRLVDVLELPDGRILALGTSYDAYSDTFIDGACMLSSSGDLLWAKKFNDSNGTNRMYDVKVYPNGILLTGLHVNNANSETSLAMMFTDFDLTEMCNKTDVTLTCNNYFMGSVIDVSPSQAHYASGILSTTASMGSLTPGGTETFTSCAIATGINETESLDASVYPNPVQAGDVVYVEMSASSLYTFVITDLSGKIVSTQTLTGNRAAISTSGLSTGVYLLNVTEHAHPVSVQKLLVK